MANELGQHYFDEIKRIWRPFEAAARSKGTYIIPFCTPIVMNPPALVIGTNHSEFAPGEKNKKKSLQIAKMYSRAVPTINTYTEHTHRFAVGLHRICDRAGIEVTEDWMGTNRCAVQWEAGRNKVEEIKAINTGAFNECQRQMDELLEDLIGTVRPRNVILAGKYACGLRYDHAADRTFDDMEPFDWNDVRVIGIESPTSHFFWPQAGERLKDYFRRE
jgi:hypothetical protein